MHFCPLCGQNLDQREARTDHRLTLGRSEDLVTREFQHNFKTNSVKESRNETTFIFRRMDSATTGQADYQLSSCSAKNEPSRAVLKTVGFWMPCLFFMFHVPISSF